MTRRTLLASLAGAFALDPERALWVPGAKLISIPAPRIRQEFWLGIDLDIYGQSSLEAHEYFKLAMQQLRSNLERHERASLAQAEFLPLHVPSPAFYDSTRDRFVSSRELIVPGIGPVRETRDVALGYARYDIRIAL